VCLHRSKLYCARANTQVFDVLEIVFTTVFSLELLVNFVSAGPRSFFQVLCVHVCVFMCVCVCVCTYKRIMYVYVYMYVYIYISHTHTHTHMTYESSIILSH